jgi:hypothetical protein
MACRRRGITVLVTLGLTTAAAAVTAQQRPPRLAKNTVFAEVSFILFAGNASLNYERRLNDWLSARVGVGAGYAVPFFGIAGGGGMGMLVFTTSRSASKFEGGLGVSFMTTGYNDPTAHAYPSITIGYRHQRPQGGFVFRVGANWTYLYGIPYQISFGHAF